MHQTTIASSRTKNVQSASAMNSSNKKHEQIVQPVLPALEQQTSSTVTFYTYRAQLTFRLKPSKNGVNVAEQLNR